MIEDKELRDLFSIESTEHIQCLDDGLLRLEKTPDDTALIEAMFREAHSLKGAARMLGLTDIQSGAHRIEDGLGAAKRGDTALTAEALDGMYRELSAIRELVNAACGQAHAEQVIADSGLRNTGSQTNTQPTGLSASSPPEAFRIDSIRVAPQKLDGLMSQTGELTVAKTRIGRWLTEIDGLLDSCDEWTRALHTRLFSAADMVERLGQMSSALNKLRNGAYADGARLDYIADRLEDGVRAIRLLPLSTIFNLFPRLVRDLAREQGKEAELLVEGGDTAADKRILEEMKDPLMHMLRNAIDHGIETPRQREEGGKPRGGTIRLKAWQTATHIVIEVADDGCGLDPETIRQVALKRGIASEGELAAMSAAQLQSLIFVSGFSTSGFVSDVSGRGVGLDVVRNNVDRLKGIVQTESLPGQGLAVRVQLPITVATARVLIVVANGCSCAIPVEYVQTSRMAKLDEIFTMEGRATLMLDGLAISVAKLANLLEFPASQSAILDPPSSLPCIVLAVGQERFGLLADALVDEQEVVLKPQCAMLRRVRNVSGATLLETGEVCMVLNPQDLLKSLRKLAVAVGAAQPAESVAARKKTLLLVEDSITTRTQEKRILEGAGYAVVTAVDGMDAFNKLGTRAFDGVVSDIVMPNMDGLALTRKIRQVKKYAELPVILVTSLASEDDQRRGLEVGANAYITKPAFDQQVLLDCLRRLI